METNEKKSKILRGNITFRGLFNDTKHGPFQTNETIPLEGKNRSMRDFFLCQPRLDNELQFRIFFLPVKVRIYVIT